VSVLTFTHSRSRCGFALDDLELWRIGRHQNQNCTCGNISVQHFRVNDV